MNDIKVLNKVHWLPKYHIQAPYIQTLTLACKNVKWETTELRNFFSNAIYPKIQRTISLAIVFNQLTNKIKQINERGD